MANIKSAQKKIRQDVKRAARNKKYTTTIEVTTKAVRKSATVATASAAYKAIDKAAKVGQIHKNKAARLKSKVAKSVK